MCRPLFSRMPMPTAVVAAVYDEAGKLGQMKMYVDDKVVAAGKFRTQSGHYALCGEGLCIGYDSGDSISAEYKGRFPFTGGRIIKVVYDVAKDVYVDVERAMAASMARD